MNQLIAFLTRNRNFIIFLILEIISFRLFILGNSYAGATYFNTSNLFIAKILSFSSSIREYGNLKEVNTILAEENRRLNSRVVELEQLKPANAPAGYLPDSNFTSRFRFTTAKVILNETSLSNNYITIDKGTRDGILPGMGVVSSTGVVGTVRFCSDQFSVVTSILHSKFMISSKLLRSGEIGTAKWEGRDPQLISLNDISRYKKLMKGDTAVTSDFNAVFPSGIMVGTVTDFSVHADQTSYMIEMKLATDFKNLSFVYVVENKVLSEQQKLLLNIDDQRK